MNEQSMNYYSNPCEIVVDYLAPLPSQPRNATDDSNLYETYDMRTVHTEAPRGATISKRKKTKTQGNFKTIFAIALSFGLIIISLGIGVAVLVKGIMDNMKQQQSISENFDLLQQRLENMSLLEQHKRASALRAGYELLDNGWKGLFNGYQYKVIQDTLNFTRSMEACSNVSTRLAVYGVQDMSTRRILSRAFPYYGYTWIGLQRKDGTWRWQDWNPASNATALWYPGRPTADNDCAHIYFNPRSHLLSYDYPCAFKLYPLCEKAWKG